jgi:hypothetical protein
MPEMLEVEAYRGLAEGAGLRRRIAAVNAPDAWYLKRGLQAPALEVLVGCQLVAARRLDKLLLLETETGEGDAGPVPCLRFGMSGRLVIDGTAGVAELRHSSSHPLPRYERFGWLSRTGGTSASRTLAVSAE